jgi:hypothetical protein
MDTSDPNWPYEVSSSGEDNPPPKRRIRRETPTSLWRRDLNDGFEVPGLRATDNSWVEVWKVLTVPQRKGAGEL